MTKIETSPIELGDLRTLADLRKVYSEAFDMPLDNPGAEHDLYLLSNPNLLFLVAKADGRVIGGMTVYLLPQIDTLNPQAYVDDLGVAKAWQRKGIGTQLMKTLFLIAEERSYYQMYLLVDRANEGSVQFYESLKGASLEVLEYTFQDFGH
jgi:aminoglycoside 3-N-acetyltransferase I